MPVVGEGCWWLAMVWSRHGESTGVGCARWVGDSEAAGVSTSRMQGDDEVENGVCKWVSTMSMDGRG
jgi:hypothetical protein